MGRGSEVQSHPQPHSELETSLRYRRSYIKEKKSPASQLRWPHFKYSVVICGHLAIVMDSTDMAFPSSQKVPQKSSVTLDVQNHPRTKSLHLDDEEFRFSHLGCLFATGVAE